MFTPNISYAKSDQEKMLIIQSMVQAIHNQFNVRTIQATTLKNLMKTTQKDIVLVDVRSRKEQAVSMIPGAITQEAFEANSEAYRNKQIVAYCTIGYRSAIFTKQYQRQGYDIQNLEGSLLSWLHAGGTVVDGQGNVTHRVHTYGQQWDLVPNSYQSEY